MSERRPSPAPERTDNTVARLWSQADLELGEGPRWVDGRLVLVDILAGSLWEADRDGELCRLCRVGEPLGAVG